MISAFFRGAYRTRRDAAADLHLIESFFREECLYGPAGMALAAGQAVRSGADAREIRTLIRRATHTIRMFRPRACFDFTGLTMARSGYCAIVRILFGVLRAPPKRRP